VSLKGIGYTQREVSWTVENDTPKAIKVEMSSNVGTLKVDSTPTNANISIDGEPRGHTPFNDRLEQGQHKVRVEKEGYAIFEQLVTVNRDKTSATTAELQMLPGSIAVTSSPTGAAVFIGNRQYENTPTEIKNLQPGPYSIKIEKSGFDPATRDITLHPGQALEIELSLDSNTGGIDLIANPPGVTVYLDGKLVGTTEADPDQAGSSKLFCLRNLSMGDHTVTIAHKRAIPDRRSITVTIKKGRVERVPVVNMWIANTTLKLKSGQVFTGRLVSKTDEEILFEPEPGIRQTYKQSEVLSLKPLKEQE
jgi:hypothetical protein